MNKRTFLFSLAAFIFLSGFFAGKGLWSKNEKQPLIKIHFHKLRQINQSAKKSVHKPAKVLIGYVQDFRNPDSINYKNLTHIIFAFAHPTKDGHLLLNGKMAQDNLRAVVNKAHRNGTKAMLAVGGWYSIQGGESYHYFQPAITNPVSRSLLAHKLAEIADGEKLDGIDVDFEHPHTQRDAQNLSLFVRELSQLLHQDGKELSIAVHSKINSVSGLESHYVVHDPSMFRNVDYVNIMAYDGQWDEGYHAANLSPYPFTEKIVGFWSKLFDQNHLPREKLVLGVPAYGQPEKASAKQVSYSAIIKNNQKNSLRDTVKMNDTTYYYNGAGTIQRKTALAINHDFGGMMLWETGLDAQGPGSLTAAISSVYKQNTLLAIHAN